MASPTSSNSFLRTFSWTRRIVNLYNYEDEFGNKIFKITRLGQDPLNIRYVEFYETLYFVVIDILSIIKEGDYRQVWEEIPEEYKCTLREFMITREFLCTDKACMTLDVMNLDGVLKLFWAIPSISFAEAAKYQDVFVYFYRINFRFSSSQRDSPESSMNLIQNTGARERVPLYHCCFTCWYYCVPSHNTFVNLMAFCIGFLCAFCIFYFM